MDVFGGSFAGSKELFGNETLPTAASQECLTNPLDLPFCCSLQIDETHRNDFGKWFCKFEFC